MLRAVLNTITLGTAALLFFVLAGCAESGAGGSSHENTGARPIVHAVNYPLAYFAERIGGNRVDVRFLTPADIDPAFWSPTDADVAALQAADLLLLNGATYEKWRPRVSLPESRIVNTSRAFVSTLITVTETTTHSHGPEGEHSHTGVAFTTWIDMRQARQQVEAVRDALASLVPDAQAEFESNAATLLSEIDRLDADLAAVASTIGDRPLVASHPVYQYFARRYGLAIESVLWEPETVPDEAAMADLEDLLSRHAAAWMIWEGEPDPASVAKLDAIGVGSVVFDPCGNRPEAESWMDVMRENVERLKAIGR